MRFFGLLLLFSSGLCATQPFFDRTHPSKIFGEQRNYRIFLPPAYEQSDRRYPVIYYFHGHSDRYTLERYDNGTDTVPKIAAFVAANDVIVIAPDGYVARHYTGFYGGTPYDVREDGGDYDYGEYFRELVAHIDGKYRTLTSRRYRATSGLSMGGFASLFLSARYPELIGSASAFNPGPEFYLGPKGRRVLWRPKDHVPSHTQTMVRLIRASGDYISQYHEETREAYARTHDVDFEYRVDEYHRHWATSIAETFRFHLRAFGNSILDNVPETFSYSSPNPEFAVRGWKVQSQSRSAGLIYLTAASQTGFRLTTRQWAPDGPPQATAAITITTPPSYVPGAQYTVLTLALDGADAERSMVTADAQGRLTLRLTTKGAQVGINGPGAGAHPPILLPVTKRDRLVVASGQTLTLPLRVFNPRLEAAVVSVSASSEYPTVRIVRGEDAPRQIPAGGVATMNIQAAFVAGAGTFAHARLNIRLGSITHPVDVFIAPDTPPAPSAFQVLDGRTVTLSVFRQKGNQGGGASLERTITEGKGNGNGVLEPGEQATIWVKMPQGIDPFDKNNWYRAKVYSDSPHVHEVARMEEQKQLEWTSAKELTSVIELAATTPAGTIIPLLLDNESWSYHFTPDARYGKEKLYQAFQLHTHHVHRLELKTR